MTPEPPQRWRPWSPKVLAWLLLGGICGCLLHLTFWYGNGREEFMQHWGYPDRTLGFGETRLYVLMFVLGLPGGALVARAFAGHPFVESFAWRPFWNSRRGLLIPAALAALGAFVIAHLVTDYAWFTDDEQAYLLQAKLYAKGQLTMPVFEPRAVLKHGFVVEVLPRDGVAQWTGVYPPLQPFLMALSSFLGSPNLSQFLCVGLIVYHTGRFAQDWLRSEATGTVAAWLCLSSPLLLGLGSTYHTSVLGTLLTVASARLSLWALARGGIVPGIALGLVAGAIVLGRPMEGTIVVGLVSLVLLAACLQRFVHGRRESGARGPSLFTALLGFGLGGLVPATILVLVNLSLTGHPLQGAYSILEKEIGRFIGFGSGMMWGREHSPELGVVQTVTSLVRLNAFVFGWPLSLGLVALSLWRPFRSGRVLFLLGVSALHLGAYFFLAFGSVHDFGHAYHVWHLPTVATLSAHVLVTASDPSRCASAVATLGRWLRYGVVAMAAVAVGVFWPAQLTRWHDVSEIIHGPVRSAKAAVKDSDAIVLWSTIQPPGTQRTWVFRPPTPDPEGHLLWAYDSPPWYPELKRRFPDRAFYRLRWEGRTPVVKPMRP